MVAPGCARPNTPRSDAKDIGQLDHDLADRIWTMMRHAPRRALYAVSLFRDPGRQWELRRERCPGHECDFARCKGYPTTATPYGSNHTKRLAADLGGLDLDWAWRNAARFGLHTPVKGEKWHFEKHGTPQVPIIPYPGKRWDAPAAPAPAPQPEELTMDKEAREAFDALNDKIDGVAMRAEAIQNETTDGANEKLGGISKRVILALTRIEKLLKKILDLLNQRLPEA